jgi:hypothetical protein
MVSGNWSHENIVDKMFTLDLLHNAQSYYYFLLWPLLNDMFYIWRWYFVWIYGILNKWNEMKRNRMFSRAPLRDTSQLTRLKDTKNRLQIQANWLTHAMQQVTLFSQQVHIHKTHSNTAQHKWHHSFSNDINNICCSYANW